MYANCTASALWRRQKASEQVNVKGSGRFERQEVLREGLRKERGGGGGGHLCS